MTLSRNPAEGKLCLISCFMQVINIKLLFAQTQTVFVRLGSVHVKLFSLFLMHNILSAVPSHSRALLLVENTSADSQGHRFVETLQVTNIQTFKELFLCLYKIRY